MSFYRCDPLKHTKCKKTNCYIVAGNCYLTTHREFASNPEPYEGDRMNKTCENCAKATKRSAHSFKTYGSYHRPYECTKTDTTAEIYKTASETCEDFKPKRPKARNKE